MYQSVAWGIHLEFIDLPEYRSATKYTKTCQLHCFPVYQSVVLLVVEEQIPVSKVSVGSDKKNLYVNHQSIAAIKKKHTKWLKYQHSKTDENYTQYKIARNAAIPELRKSKYSYEKDLAVKIKTDSRLFWSYVRSKIKTKSNIGQLETPDGSCTNEDNEKAKILNNYFVSVFAKEGSEVLPNFEDRNFGETLSNLDINTVKISKTVDKLKTAKSQGPDNIHPKFIKECKESLLRPLEMIFKNQ